MNDAIGGYFEWELPYYGGFLHDDGVLLNSGRNALEYVLRTLGDVNQVLIPYYTCDVILEPFCRLGISYTYYHVNQNLELDELPSLQNGECLIYTNYFGIKDEYVGKLAEKYGSQLIVDNAQAWFAEPIKEVGTIYSPRKYVGIPDGGVAYCSKHKYEQHFEHDLSYEHCSHLLKRIDLGPSEGYADFKVNNMQLAKQPIKQMSRLTQRMLSSVDFEMVRNRRKKNFEYLHKHLKDTNLLHIPSMDSFACPMVYPYLTDDVSIKQRLIENKVYVATYWPNVRNWTTEEMLENKLLNKLVPIPCDQRYDCDHMARIISIVFNK